MSMNAQHLSYGIVTCDRDKAKKQLDKIILEFVQTGDNILRYCDYPGGIFAEFESGKCIKWIKPNINNRGYRLHGAYVDEELRNTDTYIYAVAIPSDLYNENGIYWFS